MAGTGVAALETVAEQLRCPHCGSRFELRGATLACERGHRYDVARQGYVSLFAATGPPRTADTAAMVAAREAFLAAGHYEPIARAVADAAERMASPPGTGADERSLPPGTGADERSLSPGTGADERSLSPGTGADGRSLSPEDGGSGLVVDVGAGTGYHLAAVLDRCAGGRGLALDASRDAVRRAMRAHPGIAGVACDVWRPLPVRDGAAGLVLNVFAPRQPGELARILAPHGGVVVVTPGPRHLEELIEPLGMLSVGGGKQERLREAFAPALEPDAAARRVEFPLSLTRDDARALVAMGPSAHHVDVADLDRRLAALPEPVRATASVVVDTFRRP